MKLEHKPTGWNTWDFHGFNRLVYLQGGETRLALRYAIWDETVPAPVPPPDPDHRKIGRLYEHFRWEHVTKLGPHAPLGLPARLEFKAGETPYSVEAIARGGALHLTLTPLRNTPQRVLFILAVPVGAALTVTSRSTARFAGWNIHLRGATWPADYFVNVAEPYAVGAPGRPATLLVKPAETRKRRPARRTPWTAPGTFAALAHDALAGHGALADAPAAMMQAISWNTLYDTRRRLVSSPVSRDWCADWRGVLTFCWDTYLVAAMMSYEAPHLARLNLETVTAAIDELGFVPNYYMAHGAASRDRSMPPLGTYAIWKTQRYAPDRRWLAEIYPRLCRWHAFWMTHRQGRRDGLLAWGSDPVPYAFPQLVPYNGILQHTRQAAMYESGLDNSPLFDDVPFNVHTHTLELDDVALNSYYALDCEALAGLADLLHRPADAARFRREHTAHAQRINRFLWDEAHGIYCNRLWRRDAGQTDRLSQRWAPTSFFPLLAGVAPPDRARRLVHEHLLNEREFWGPHVIPSIARCDPAYHDNDYWRGRIWGPFNYLVAEGLRRYRFDDAAAELARKSLGLFMQNWRADGGVYENYNAETGQGNDVWNAARLYHWGGLLAFVALQELIDVEPAGFLRVGSLTFPDSTLCGVRLGRDRFDVQLDHGVRAVRNRKPFLECSVRAIVRLPLDPGESITLSTREHGTLTLSGVSPSPARLDDGRLIAPKSRRSRHVYTW